MLARETGEPFPIARHFATDGPPLERTVAQLRELQEKQDLDNFLDVMEMYESKGETANA
jgi:hypothetical protein